jgi:hypothetical protein
MSAGQRLFNAHIAGTDNRALAGAALDLSPILFASLGMPASGVTAGVYGHSTLAAQLTIDASGRVTNATEYSLGGGGTVTSFSAGDLSPLFTASVATATSTPALTFALADFDANKGLFGPVSGASGPPTVRSLVLADIPAGLPYLASVALTVPAVFAVTGSPLIADGTLAVTWATNSVQNQILASPDGSTGAIDLRAMVVNDLPVTSLGALFYGGAAGAPAVLSGSTASGQRFLSQTGDGTDSAPPSWQPLPAAGLLTYYFSDTASSIATYKKQLTTPATPKTTFSTSGLGTGNTVLGTGRRMPAFRGSRSFQPDSSSFIFTQPRRRE